MDPAAVTIETGGVAMTVAGFFDQVDPFQLLPRPAHLIWNPNLLDTVAILYNRAYNEWQQSNLRFRNAGRTISQLNGTIRDLNATINERNAVIEALRRRRNHPGNMVQVSGVAGLGKTITLYLKLMFVPDLGRPTATLHPRGSYWHPSHL
jgi:hypothetical protein